MQDHLPSCLSNEQWVLIGYLSEIRIAKNKLEHKLNGVVKSFPISWLTTERPLLLLALQGK